ncbi:IclR family transcriptional regulator [Ahrensia sp. 13_GOM-1096m]|uniref:IclR family transcriptional regulator n=1 Tax=Ahrensia sp. 13_GOM-1096m TaxID=1380380 RepID=UPI00047AC8FD|nr:IclR family transcriptional regulator [Ahrensia sp. 13_GOM-1096m]
MASEKPDHDTGTLGKAVAVLDAVAASNTPMRFRDLAAHIDQPRGTLHRQVSNLIEEGLLEVNADQSYSLGFRLLKFAARAWSGSGFREIAEPHLKALHERTGETVHLGILKGIEVIYLDKVESRQAVRMHSQVGNSSPCYCTGVGKAGLSVLPNAEIETRIANISFKQFTETTLMSEQALMSELDQIRASGNAYDREEHEPGIHCVAAPIFTNNFSVIGGLSVTAPCYRVPIEKLESWAEDVRSVAKAIMEELPIKLGPRA